jgi:hypothetical protein
MSLKDKILNYLKEKDDWVHKGEIGRVAVNQWNFENENMGRRCRELYKAGRIDKEIRKNEVWYRYRSELLAVRELREIRERHEKEKLAEEQKKQTTRPRL